MRRGAVPEDRGAIAATTSCARASPGIEVRGAGRMYQSGTSDGSPGRALDREMASSSSEVRGPGLGRPRLQPHLHIRTCAEQRRGPGLGTDAGDQGRGQGQGQGRGPGPGTEAGDRGRGPGPGTEAGTDAGCFCEHGPSESVGGEGHDPAGRPRAEPGLTSGLRLTGRRLQSQRGGREGSVGTDPAAVGVTARAV